jgi:hypothetical protein
LTYDDLVKLFTAYRALNLALAQAADNLVRNLNLEGHLHDRNRVRVGAIAGTEVVDREGGISILRTGR